MHAFKRKVFYKFIWREATTRKHEVFSSLALTSYKTAKTDKGTKNYMEITGYVDHIIYRKPENGYTVFILVSEGDEITCVGNLGQIDQGDYLLIEGEEVEKMDALLSLAITGGDCEWL